METRKEETNFDAFLYVGRLLYLCFKKVNLVIVHFFSDDAVNAFKLD